MRSKADIQKEYAESPSFRGNFKKFREVSKQTIKKRDHNRTDVARTYDNRVKVSARAFFVTEDGRGGAALPPVPALEPVPPPRAQGAPWGGLFSPRGMRACNLWGPMA